MNSDKPDQVMENNAITSKNKKKSKGKSKTDAALTDVIGRSTKKSFWKSLFRFKKHHDDPGNSSTHVITVELGNNNEESKSAPNERLSSIFEETADPASLDPKTIAEDISEIQETIKRMSETSSPTVIVDKISQNYSPTNIKSTKKRSKDDAFLGYLSDISSTSSEDEGNDEDEELEERDEGEEAEESKQPKEKQEEQPPPEEFSGIPNQDNNSTYTDLLADDKPNKGSSSLLKEGYSFEYSETSEISNGEVVEEKPEKVTFDNKVETKDANSIIMVRPLDENDSKVVIDEAVAERADNDEAVVDNDEIDDAVIEEVVINEVVKSAVVETNEYMVNESQEFRTIPQLEEFSNITEEDIIVARIQEIVNGQITPPENLITFEEEPAEAEAEAAAATTTTMDNTPAAASSPDAFSLPLSQIPQKATNRTFYSIPPEDAKPDEIDSLDRDGANRFVEELEPSTSSISKNSTYVHQDLDETLDIESIEEETELWMEDLNDFSFIPTPEMVPLEDLDDDANIDNEIFREFRLNKFFKMIQNNITMNVSIAYDPLFENEPMIQNLHSAIVEQEVRNEERNKVIRKRKMMSLLHDKQVFKDYMKEIEEENVCTQNVPNSSSNIKTTEQTANEENEHLENENEEDGNEGNANEEYDNEENPGVTLPIKIATNKVIDMSKVPRGNIFNEATLLNLQTTKTKLENILVEKNGFKNQVKSVYPKQYLRVYNLQTNRVNEDGLEEMNNSSIESYASMSCEDLAQNKSDTTLAKSPSAVFSEKEAGVGVEVEVVEKLSPSLHTKICAYETIDRDVEQIITDLMGHVTDLKESCIKYGAPVSIIPEDDPVLFRRHSDMINEVQQILNEVLEKVFASNDDVLELSRGNFNQCFSFIREFGKINEDKTALSYQIKPVVKNYYQTENPLTLTENLQRANGYLSAVYEEMCEYNPVPILSDDDLERNENIQFIDEANMENFEEPITEQPIPFNGDLIDFDYQTDFETELSVIHEEDEPASLVNDSDNNNNNNNNISNTINAVSLDIAENIIQFIEKSVSEKLSSIQDNCRDLQDYDEDTLTIAQTFTEHGTKTSNIQVDNLEDNEETNSICESNYTKTNSSNVKFSLDNDFASASNSRNNKFEPQPGTSKQQANEFIKTNKSSATICSSMYNLPSVPSTELMCTENSSEHSEIDNEVYNGVDNGIETLLTKKFSELPNSSTEDIKPEDLQALLAYQVSSSFSQGVPLLERKTPQTNFLELLRNLSVDSSKNLTKIEIDKCIEENLKCFQESIKETIKLNQKTIEMLQKSSSENSATTPDVLTIISTLSCNMPEETVPVLAATSEDARLDKTEETENETYSQLTTALTTITAIVTTTATTPTIKSEGVPVAQPRSQKLQQPQQPQQPQQSQQPQQPQQSQQSQQPKQSQQPEQPQQSQQPPEWEGDQTPLSNIPEEEENEGNDDADNDDDDDGIGSDDNSSSSSTITVVANSIQLDAMEANTAAGNDPQAEEEDLDLDNQIFVSDVEITSSSEILNNPDILKNTEL